MPLAVSSIAIQSSADNSRLDNARLYTSDDGFLSATISLVIIVLNISSGLAFRVFLIRVVKLAFDELVA